MGVDHSHVPDFSTEEAQVTSHHALLYVGTHALCLLQVPASARSGVDSVLVVAEQLEIADVRMLIDQAGRRPIGGETRSFIISVTTLTHEAQNALLKLLEDPPATAQFYIIVPRLGILLPTLRSRLHLLYTEERTHNAPTAETVSFFRAGIVERLAHIARLAKNKDTAGMRSLVRGIEGAVASAIRQIPDTTIISDVLLASRYSDIRGASHKMLLEHLAFSVPGGLVLS